LAISCPSLCLRNNPTQEQKTPAFPVPGGLEFIIVPQGSAGDIMADLNGHAARVSDAHVLSVIVVNKKPTLPPRKDSRDD